MKLLQYTEYTKIFMNLCSFHGQIIQGQDILKRKFYDH